MGLFDSIGSIPVPNFLLDPKGAGVNLDTGERYYSYPHVTLGDAVGTFGDSLLQGFKNVVTPWNADFSGFRSALDNLGDDLGAFASDMVSDLNDGLDSLTSALPFDSGSSAAGVAGLTLSPATFDYLNAELAGAYGMDRNTAYQEALANTSYQRAVQDMQRAGLNPAAIFGNGRGSVASGVGYVGSASSASGYAKSQDKLFSTEDFGFIASLSGLVTAVATKNPSNFWLGQQGAQAVMQVLNGLDSKLK